MLRRLMLLALALCAFAALESCGMTSAVAPLKPEVKKVAIVPEAPTTGGQGGESGGQDDQPVAGGRGH